jgi:23S rRNA (uracil1939-C5)-methyltransferase
LKPDSLKKHSELTGEIVDIAFGGEGIVKHEGAVIFVPFTALGDVVRIQITDAQKKFYRASLIKILKPSHDRVEPPCPYFGTCGGCQYQHISYESEQKLKVKQLHDIMQRLGGFQLTEIRPLIHAEPYHYRNRISVHHKGHTIGFHSIDHQIIDIERCLLATEEVNDKLTYLHNKPGRRDHYSLRAKDVQEHGFHQTNSLLMQRLLETVTQSISENIAALIEGYSGIGFFTQPLSKKLKQIICIESDPRAVEIATKSAAPNTTVLEGTCESLLPQAHQQLNHKPTACLIDPPREGLSEQVRKDLLDLDFSQLIYLSCNPATLARDLKSLSSKWTLEYLQPIDLFPRTAHLEVLAVLNPIA